MTPRDFLKKYNDDQRLVTGEFYSSEPLVLRKGDRVGVVLLNHGGPFNTDDIAPFLYNFFMDPAMIDMPLNGIFRHWLANFIARTRAKRVARDYRQIGGMSPINRLTQEQSEKLEAYLNAHYASKTGASFKTYVAMRYWHPMSEETARRMQQDGVSKVVLLPLYPQYSKTRSGSSLLYWWQLEQAGEIKKWPTTFVQEFAANPKYIRALNERIDEGLQRFSRDVRSKVHLVFSAHGTPVRELKERRDPYCCLVHNTVEQVMQARSDDRAYDVSFQGKVGPGEWLTPSTWNRLKSLSESGTKGVLMVPVSFVSDQVETAFDLDITLREQAETFGIHHYEVMSGLNSHSLFIEALAEATLAQLVSTENIAEPSGDGDSSHVGDYPLRPLNELPRFDIETRCNRCHQCDKISSARRWTVSASDDGLPANLKPRPAS